MIPGHDFLYQQYLWNIRFMDPHRGFLRWRGNTKCTTCAHNLINHTCKNIFQDIRGSIKKTHNLVPHLERHFSSPFLLSGKLTWLQYPRVQKEINLPRVHFPASYVGLHRPQCLNNKKSECLFHANRLLLKPSLGGSGANLLLSECH